MHLEWIYRYEGENTTLFCGKTPSDSFVSFVNFLHFCFSIFILVLTRMETAQTQTTLLQACFLRSVLRLRPQTMQCRKWECMTLNIACAKGTIFAFFIILLSYLSARKHQCNIMWSLCLNFLLVVLNEHINNSHIYIDFNVSVLFRQTLKNVCQRIKEVRINKKC